MDDEGRHDVRIEIKKLRYGLEFVRNLHLHEDTRRKRFLKALEGLQETLGELNDVVTAGELAYAGVSTPAIDDKQTVRRRLPI